jgi:hypothetical protein
MAEYDEFRAPESRIDEKPGFQQTIDMLKINMSKLSSDLSNLAQKLKVRQALDQIREQGKRTTETVGYQIKEKPLMSSLVVFGAGFLLGSVAGFFLSKLLDRRLDVESQPD